MSKKINFRTFLYSFFLIAFFVSSALGIKNKKVRANGYNRLMDIKNIMFLRNPLKFAQYSDSLKYNQGLWM